MFDFETRVLIGWLVRIFTSQPIRTRASKSNIFVFMLRWPTFFTASIITARYIFLAAQKFPIHKSKFREICKKWDCSPFSYIHFFHPQIQISARFGKNGLGVGPQPAAYPFMTACVFGHSIRQ